MLSVALPLSGVSCAHDGTLVTLNKTRAAAVSAVDQAILADAIDQAFEQFDARGMAPKVKAAGALTAYMEVAAPLELAPTTLRYIEDFAGAAAGRIGLRVFEVVRTIERESPERSWEVMKTAYPDTDARVIFTVSYAGVDEVATSQQQEQHSSKEPDAILKGRFKGTITVAPRKTAFEAFSQTLSGESTIKFVDQQYVDKRAFWR